VRACCIYAENRSDAAIGSRPLHTLASRNLIFRENVLRFGTQSHSRKAFNFCFRPAGIQPALAARDPIPPKRMGIRHAEPRAEIRMTFRYAPERHLSVDFRRMQKSFEFLKLGRQRTK
jgi:hypothetical protein